MEQGASLEPTFSGLLKCEQCPCVKLLAFRSLWYRYLCVLGSGSGAFVGSPSWDTWTWPSSVTLPHQSFFSLLLIFKHCGSYMPLGQWSWRLFSNCLGVVFKQKGRNKIFAPPSPNWKFIQVKFNFIVFSSLCQPVSQTLITQLLFPSAPCPEFHSSFKPNHKSFLT